MTELEILCEIIIILYTLRSGDSTKYYPKIMVFPEDEYAEIEMTEPRIHQYALIISISTASAMFDLSTFKVRYRKYFIL